MQEQKWTCLYCTEVWIMPLLFSAPWWGVVFLSAPARLHACISPSRTTCIMVPFSLSIKAEEGSSWRATSTSTSLEAEINHSNHQIKKINPKKNIQQPNDALFRDKIVLGRTRAICLNSVIPSPVLVSVPCSPAPAWADNKWVHSLEWWMGLSHGLVRRGCRAIWKWHMEAHSRRWGKRRGVTEIYIKESVLLLKMQGSSV